MKFFYLNRNLLLCTLASLIMICSPVITEAQEEKPQQPAAAEEEKPSVVLSSDFLSQYISRGLAYSNDSFVVQPSIIVSYEGFSLNVWGNFDTYQRSQIQLLKHEPKWNETDFTLSYGHELVKNLTVTLGNVYYSYPNARFDGNEVFGGMQYTLPWFSITFTTYKEVTHTPGWWMQLDFLKSIPLPYHGMSLDLLASFGYQVLNDEDTVLNLQGKLGSYSAFHSGTLQASLKIPVCKYVSIAPKIAVAFPLTRASSDYIEANSWDTEDIHVFGGMNVTATF
jgi:uncharacterized protein (TIGR02001 family)